MAADDFDVICYKVLAYLYRCIKEGVAHLEESRPMARARAFLGGAFETALKVAVEAGRAL